ncbi:MAG: ferrous iron transport protein A [Treponemataceae bacterium]|nr:ferrous iron transport protein A [Treponemataceae bacterium]
MIPLIFADSDKSNIIRKIGGNPEVKQHLADMGFVPGAEVTLISENNGNIIVNVKETRVAISREMAQKIMI